MLRFSLNEVSNIMAVIQVLPLFFIKSLLGDRGGLEVEAMVFTIAATISN